MREKEERGKGKISQQKLKVCLVTQKYFGLGEGRLQREREREQRKVTKLIVIVKGMGFGWGGGTKSRRGIYRVRSLLHFAYSHSVSHVFKV